MNDKLGRVAEINMNAQGSDNSFLRQSLAFESYVWAGNQSSESFLMQMRVNGSRDRVGVFIEQVDEDLLERYGLDPDGALYKFVQRSNLDPVFADTTTGIEKKTRLEEGKEDVQVVVDGLTRSSAAARANSVFDNFNVAQMLNYLAVRSVTMDADDVRKNFYMYRDTNGTGQWSILPWDKDWTFGVLGDGGPSLTHPFFGDQAHLKTNANQWNRLYDAVFNDPVLSEMYLRRLRTVMDELLQPPGTPAESGRYETRIDEMLAQAGNLLSSSAISQANGDLKRFFPARRETLYVEHSIDNLTQGELRDIIPEFAQNVQYFVPTDDSLGQTWTGLEPPANIAQWQTGQAGFGFNERFADLIRTEVNTGAACADCTSMYLRIPFEITDASAISALTLRMKFDDGFIAYLNGVEVARGNVTDDPAYNVRARTRSNTVAVEFANYNISAFASSLRDGTNVLAIQSVNSSPTSNDQLVMPVLIEGIIGDDSAAGIPHEQVGNPPVTFGAFEHNPASGNQDEEFIELRNPLKTAVDISGWRIGGGIEHTFPPGTVIPAEGSMFISPNVPAFLGRESSPRGNEGLFVQGNYLGHLSNFGETIELHASDGTLMDRFTTPITPTDSQLYLRVSEVYFNPPGADELTEFIELTNISGGATATTLDLAGVTLTEGPAEAFQFAAGTTLAPGEFLIVARDPVAFQAAYPDVAASQLTGPFLGSLSNAGEAVVLDDAQGSTILSFTYGDSQLWPRRADGEGASLELIDPAGTSVDLLSKPSVWRGSTDVGGSPGRPATLPLGVVINEVLTNANQPGLQDSIELYNTTNTAIDLTGWYLSDNPAQLKGYALPSGTMLNAGQYLVVTAADFNGPGAGENGFGLSSDGDQVWLVRTDPASGAVVQFADELTFGAAAPGESFGRVPNGTGKLEPLTALSLGSENGAPRVGPVVISELQYHPGSPSAAALAIYPSLTTNDLEYVEIHNPTASPILLTDWRIRGGIELDFDPGTALPAGGTLLVIPFNPGGRGNTSRTVAFRTHYGLSDSVTLVGGYRGQLSDSDDRVQLQRARSAVGDGPRWDSSSVRGRSDLRRSGALADRRGWQRCVTHAPLGNLRWQPGQQLDRGDALAGTILVGQRRLEQRRRGQCLRHRSALPGNPNVRSGIRLGRRRHDRPGRSLVLRRERAGHHARRCQPGRRLRLVGPGGSVSGRRVRGRCGGQLDLGHRGLELRRRVRLGRLGGCFSSGRFRRRGDALDRTGAGLCRE